MSFLFVKHAHFNKTSLLRTHAANPSDGCRIRLASERFAHRPDDNEASLLRVVELLAAL
jgi:hypothetical protein